MQKAEKETFESYITVAGEEGLQTKLYWVPEKLREDYVVECGEAISYYIIVLFKICSQTYHQKTLSVSVVVRFTYHCLSCRLISMEIKSASLWIQNNFTRKPEGS